MIQDDFMIQILCNDVYMCRALFKNVARSSTALYFSTIHYTCKTQNTDLLCKREKCSTRSCLIYKTPNSCDDPVVTTMIRAGGAVEDGWLAGDGRANGIPPGQSDMPQLVPRLPAACIGFS